MARSGAVPSGDHDEMGVIGRAAAALGCSGLVLRGGLNFAPDEARPPGPGGRPARAVLLVGNIGAGYWPAFTRWRESQPRSLRDPLDRWSREMIGRAAETVGARVAMPNDRPFAPFQQWAMRAEGLRPSPLGLLMHPRFGLWHAFRGALLLDVALSQRALQGLTPKARAHPCDLCTAKPCLTGCPVGAYCGKGFAYETCIAHVANPEGAACGTRCLARNACPHGTEWRYPPEMQAFHQRAFLGR